MEIKEEKFRSDPKVNQPADMIQVTITCTLKEWYAVRKKITQDTDVPESSEEIFGEWYVPGDKVRRTDGIYGVVVTEAEFRERWPDAKRRVGSAPVDFYDEGIRQSSFKHLSKVVDEPETPTPPIVTDQEVVHETEETENPLTPLPPEDEAQNKVEEVFEGGFKPGDRVVEGDLEGIVVTMAEFEAERKSRTIHVPIFFETWKDDAYHGIYYAFAENLIKVVTEPQPRCVWGASNPPCGNLARWDIHIQPDDRHRMLCEKHRARFGFKAGKVYTITSIEHSDT